MNESLLGFVVEALDRNKGRWPGIANACGVPYRTVQKIGSGKTKTPRIDSVEKLARYFRDQQAA